MAPDRSLALFAIGLIFGGGIGFVVAASMGVTLDGHDHGDAAAHGAHQTGANDTHHHGGMLMLPDEADAPTLDASLQPDPASGWNLHIRTTGFRFSPENANLGHVAGEGHAHVYINGGKYARIYGPWLHIPSLPKGLVTVEVTLNSNDHRPLGVAGKMLTKKLELERP